VRKRSLTVAALVLFALLLPSRPGIAAPPPPTGVTVADRPNDAGEALVVHWSSPENTSEVTGFAVTATARREPAGDGKPVEPKVVEATADATSVVVDGLKPGIEYEITVASVAEDGTKSDVVSVGPVSPRINWFNTRRIWLAILLAVVCAAVLAYIAAARRGMRLWVRPIAGLEAVTDAVGRAVEMGKSVLFVPGIQDINDIQTVAGVTVLSRVARIAAEYDAEIKVPTARSLVMATCRETVEASFLQAGRPDSYHADDIYYLTDEQFGYVAGVTGQMVREQPAACFYMGAFFAESLILAETGNAIGSIQVAGTAMPSQLPFFIAACDYTLIGEEFFAASAYLSGEPQQLGSLKGQDFGKLLCAVLILAGCLLAPWAVQQGSDSTTREPHGAVSAREYLHDNMLGDEGFLPQESEQ
ncbi:MAG: fibronectin type III domain-containing protein, partial [Planctomycetaceae bacterium]